MHVAKEQQLKQSRMSMCRKGGKPDAKASKAEQQQNQQHNQQQQQQQQRPGAGQKRKADAELGEDDHLSFGKIEVGTGAAAAACPEMLS